MDLGIVRANGFGASALLERGDNGMSIEVVRSVMTRFLTEPGATVLVLKGAWGTGKTHTWDGLLKANKDRAALPTYAYVSLFGLTSITELRLALVAKSLPTKYFGDKIDWDRVNSDWKDLAKGHAKRLVAVAARFKDAMPYVKDVSISVDSIAGFVMGETIVCLDDWERATISPEALLGLISELKVEKKCKVILIFNDGQLDEEKEKIYSSYREKVVDIELAFAPTPTESVEIAVRPTDPYATLLKNSLLKLEISNVRLIRKIVSLVGLLREPLRHTRPATQQQVIQSAVLFAWVHYGEKSEKKPSIEFVRSWDRMGTALRDRHEAPDPDRERWSSVLVTYGYISTDELDLAIDQVISRGYVEGTPLLEHISSQEKLFEASDRQKVLNDAWDLYHGSFENNADEVIQALNRGVRESAQYISPMNFNSAIEVLRRLKSDAIADELIEFYIEQHAGQWDILNLKKNPFGDRVTDPQIRKRFGEVSAQQVRLPTLREAVMAAEENRGWSEEQNRVMKAATADAMYAELMAPEGVKFLAGCEWMSTVIGWEDFRDNLHSALRRIATTSPINAVRVSRFGINPDPQPTGL